jgi:hypothetical protein
LASKYLQRAAKATSLLRIILECCADKERSDNLEDDPPLAYPKRASRSIQGWALWAASLA